MSYPDRASLLSGARSRQSPSQQGFGPGGINMYHQQQIQTALYQQQQIEFAQQQAQLEMHLQLEQMRLQNLALQEQIMIGQVHAQQQAQAQAQAEQQQLLHNTFYTTNKAPVANRLNFSQGQGGLLAERALARRQQQAEADALYAQYYPNGEEDDLLNDVGNPPRSLASVDRTRSVTPPSLVVSQPDEAFPVLAAAETPGKVAVVPKLTTQSHHHSESGSSASSAEPAAAQTKPAASDVSATPPKATESAQVKSTPVAAPGKKKFSEVVKSSPPAPAPAKASSGSAASANTLAPKLNPFSSVFVPGSVNGPEAGNSVSAASTASSSTKAVSFSEAVSSNAGSGAGVYRAPRSKSPPTVKGTRTVSAPLTSLPSPVMGGMPTRQPRGPAAEAELTNQNFATRIRKRAIGAIKTLGSRPPSSPGPTTASTPTNYQYYHQQQILEALMIQQQQQQALAAAGYLDVDMGFHPGMVSPGGIAQLMATARAREERFGY